MRRDLALPALVVIFSMQVAIADVALPPTSNRPVVAVGSDWNDRINAAFPAGSSVEGLVATLSREGFVIDLDHSHADLMKFGLFCRERFQVIWTGSEVVETVTGTFGLVCL